MAPSTATSAAGLQGRVSDFFMGLWVVRVFCYERRLPCETVFGLEDLNTTKCCSEPQARNLLRGSSGLPRYGSGAGPSRYAFGMACRGGRRISITLSS